MNAFVAGIIALTLTAPGDALIRASLGRTIANRGGGRTPPILVIPFNTPGSYASGTTTLATPATAISVVRASTATYDYPAGTVNTAQTNELRVDGEGAVIEGETRNYHWYSEQMNPTDGGGWTTAASGAGNAIAVVSNTNEVTDPRGGNTAEKVTYTIVTTTSGYTALRRLYMGGVNISGNIVYSVYLRSAGVITTVPFQWFGGTSGSGFTSCTINSTTWTRCQFTFSSAVEQTFGVNIGWVFGNPANSGSGTIYAWGAQIENGLEASSYKATTGATVIQPADRITLANPITSAMSTWCVLMQHTGAYSQYSAATMTPLLAFGTRGGVNSAAFGTFNNGGFRASEFYGSSGSANNTDWWGVPSTGTHTFEFGRTTRVQWAEDGAPRYASATIPANWSATPTTMYIGSDSTANVFAKGKFKNVRVYATACPHATPEPTIPGIPTAPSLPGVSVAVNTTSLDGNNNVFIENWTNMDWWDNSPVPWAFYDVPVRTITANDGFMGSSFLRMQPAGVNDNATWTTPLVWFDEAYNAYFRYRIRLTHSGTINWAGMGVFYSGEGVYAGITSQNGTEIGFYGTPTLGPLASGDIFDVEVQWTPAGTPKMQARVSRNGAAFGAWVDAGSKAMIEKWPFTNYFLREGGVASGLPSSPGNLDLGVYKAAGKPMYGASDYIGWRNWTRTSAAYIAAPDAWNILGGLTGRESDASEFLDWNYWVKGGPHTATSTSASWSAQSPTITPVSAYRNLRFQAYNSWYGSRLQIYVRNAATGALLPDAQVPGNSTGIVSTAAADGAKGWQEVSLSAIPGGTSIFLDVRGVTTTAMGDFRNQPRLGGVWVGFQ